MIAKPGKPPNDKDLIDHFKQVPYANTAKYLGMTLDAKLKWKEHIKMKKE